MVISCIYSSIIIWSSITNKAKKKLCALIEILGRKLNYFMHNPFRKLYRSSHWPKIFRSMGLVLKRECNCIIAHNISYNLFLHIFLSFGKQRNRTLRVYFMLFLPATAPQNDLQVSRSMAWSTYWDYRAAVVSFCF